MGKKAVAVSNSKLCQYNHGVDCCAYERCCTCDFNPAVHAQRVKEIKAGMLPRFINKAETAIIMERIRKKNQQR